MSQVQNPIIGIDEDGQPVPKFVSDELRPDVIAGLVKEYHSRFRRLIARMLRLKADLRNGTRSTPPADRERMDLERVDLKLHHRILQPAALELVRYASSLVEHARIRPYERIELRLRQAELEAALKTAEQAVNGL